MKISNIENIKTLGQLKSAGYQPESIKNELRRNLISYLKSGKNPFPGIYGYDNTVIPDVQRAILSRHNINFLGLRGQAKTRIARLIVNLLDEYIPIIEGSELNEDPFSPLTFSTQKKCADMGEDLPISWLHRNERFFEKLATPDVTVADLIGDIDPIKAANLRLSLSHPDVIHFGMIPRANRGIFVINEIPDLQARIQVALFNILQEGDIQIRGYKFRLPLDILFVFTANPEDYTNRGSIVTPLKDRIGSQITTHYPKDIDTAIEITKQEAKITASQLEMVEMPEIMYTIVERIAEEARDNEFVDAKSGVSARFSISALEALYSTAERRALINGENRTCVRIFDLLGIIQAINGKIELVYEGEQEGGVNVAIHLINRAIRKTFSECFPDPARIKRNKEQDPYSVIKNWFEEGNSVEIPRDATNKEYQKILSSVPELERLVLKFNPKLEKSDKYFLMELMLFGMAEHSLLNKHLYDDSVNFSDILFSIMNDQEDENFE